MKKIFCLIALLTITLTACGRKGQLTYEGEQKRPKFNKVTDEKN